MSSPTQIIASQANIPLFDTKGRLITFLVYEIPDTDISCTCKAYNFSIKINNMPNLITYDGYDSNTDGYNSGTTIYLSNIVANIENFL